MPKKKRATVKVMENVTDQELDALSKIKENSRL
jgi:hypothetical protein